MAEQETGTETTKNEATGDADAPRGRWKLRLLMIAFSCVFALIIAEIGLRFLKIHTGGYLYKADYWTGGTLRPNATAVHANEGYAILRINSLGLRDHETTLEKPPGVFRIAVLGDSFMEAAQVDLEKSLAKALESKLRQKGRFEVLNFGVSGWGTAQEYLQLREFALGFSPDLVLLTVTTGNDFRNNSKKLSGVTCVPYFTLTPSGELEFDDSFRDTPTYKGVAAREHSLLWKTAGWIWNHSRLFGLVVTTLRPPPPPIPVNEAAPGDGTIRPADPAFEGDWLIYDPNPTADWADAWAVTEKLIDAMAGLCREKGVRFAVVLLTNGPQVSKEGRRMFAEKYPNLDLDYPGERLTNHCGERGIACLNLVPAFLAYHEQTGKFLHGFARNLGQGHWNEEGHRLGADLVYKFLLEQRLLPASR